VSSSEIESRADAYLAKAIHSFLVSSEEIEREQMVNQLVVVARHDLTDTMRQGQVTEREHGSEEQMRIASHNFARIWTFSFTDLTNFS
jgi:hypothetical protein